jgi:hypothetical protein
LYVSCMFAKALAFAYDTLFKYSLAHIFGIL